MQASHSLPQLHKAPLLEELQVSCDHSGGGGLLTADTITDPSLLESGARMA